MNPSTWKQVPPYDRNAYPTFHIHTITNCMTQNLLNENFGPYGDMLWQRSWQSRGGRMYVLTPTGSVKRMDYNPIDGHNVKVLR